MRSLTFFGVLVMMAAVPLAHAEQIVGQATVIDGDTLEIHGHRIRMTGIDAPEARQLCADANGDEYRCGKVAAFALADRVGRAAVACNGEELDRYRRLLATCTASGIDLGAWMVEQGYAVAYRHYSTAYALQEERAKAARRGVWMGKFDMPWDWRKAHR